MEAYETGTVDNFPGVGATGRLKLGVEDSTEYGPQNRVADYIAGTEQSLPTGVPAAQTQGAMKAAATAESDDVPF